jgi:PAS domain S-box-containing protein
MKTKDITRRKKTEHSFWESEENFRLFQSSVFDVIYRYDPQNNKYDFISPSVELQTGYSVEEFSSDPKKTIERITHPGDLAKVQAEVERQIAEGSAGRPFRVEYRIKRKNGREIWVSDQKTLEFSPQGKLCRINGVVRDITERKRAEEELRESQERYGNLFHHSNDAIFIHDLEGNIIDVNQKALNQFGYAEREILSLKISDLHPPEALGKSRWAFEKISKDGFVNFEIDFKKKSGRVFPAEVSSSLFEVGGKKVIQGIVRDITERKRAELARQESEEKFRSLAEESPNMIFINKKNKVVYANEKCQEIMGYAREEFYCSDFDFLTLIAPEFRESVKVNFSRHEKGKEVDPFEYALVTRQGKRIQAILNTKLIRYGGESAILGIVTDITDRKRVEEALRESEKKYRALVEVAQEGIGIVDPDENITFANRALADLLGYTKEELVGLNLRQISDEEQFAKFREESKKRRQRKASRYDARVYTQAGELKYCSISATPLFDDQARFCGTLGMLIDITDRKRTEEKLKVYTRQIEEKNLELKLKNMELTATRAQLVQKEKLRALGQMASGVAHDFNNLLSVILGRVQLLQRKAKDSETERGLRSIERAALDASSTIKRIQDFARVRKDQEFKWVNIDQVIEEVIALTKTKWKDQAEANGISIKLEVQKDRRRLPPVAGDESELKEAFTSIVFNAVDAMPKGGKIVIRTRTNRKSVFVCFIDSGIGISEEAKQKIFDPFFTTKGVKSAGLGLSVAYGIIQRHQGDIKIESKPGEGTTVVVRLPVSKTLGEEEPKEEESQKPPVQEESANILVIEDEQDVRELLFDILTPANYMVKLASGGAEGLEIYKREKFDIVFTDLGMPGMSGWEVAKAIKEIDSNTTVLLITGWGVEMDEEKLKESGIERVVTKPMKVESLLTLVSEIAESKKRIREPVEEALGHPVECKEPKI